MYNVSLGPSKILAKTRRGISQNLESFQNFNKKSFEFEEGEVMNGPRPVFHTSSKKFDNLRQQETLSPQHEELVRFVSDAWEKVCKEYEKDGYNGYSFSTDRSSGSIIYYENRDSSSCLHDFKPFDLESWWGKRLFNNITKSIP